MTIATDTQPSTCGPSCGCSPTPVSLGRAARRDVTTVGTRMTWLDRLGSVRVRFGIGRMNYRVRPGLFAVGRPGPESPVLLSSNYKLSFDHLRRSLAGRDAWILVIDTHGINVWCAVGKGHFSTDEVDRWVEAAGLSSRVSHRKLVLPQLAAPGVAAHEVKRRTGFRVVYGPVRAADSPRFLDARMTATPEMREVRSRLRDRAVLVPVEVVTGAKYPLVAAAVLFLVGSIGPHGLSLSRAGSLGSAAAALTLLAFMCGAVLGPLLLPWLPGRAFALKGAALGGVVALGLALLGWPSAAFHVSWLGTAAWGLIIPALTSFVVMNFTGSSTYTSLSGVLREMRVAVPMQIAAGLIGIGLWVTALYGATA